MQKSELTVKESEALQKSIASDLKKKDNDDKFKESVEDAGDAGVGDDRESSDKAV